MPEVKKQQSIDVVFVCNIVEIKTEKKKKKHAESRNEKKKKKDAESLKKQGVKERTDQNKGQGHFISQEVILRLRG